MFPLRSLTATLLLLAGLLAAPSLARAAESYDNCAGFIDSVPTTITTQGVWCLRKDLGTAIISGNAITIATNNVTIDCNDFKLGGLASGAGTSAYGIYAQNRLNATVHHCNIRGFNRGIYFTGSSGGGHVVEDNHFNGNTVYGLYVAGDSSVVRRNQVTDTGGSTAVTTGFAYGIFTVYAVDVLDNTVDGVLASADSNGDGTVRGIHTSTNPSGSISGNRVRGLVKLGSGSAIGINNASFGRISVRDNDISGDGSGNGTIGLYCSTNSGRAKDNIINGFNLGILTCGDAGGNDVTP